MSAPIHSIQIVDSQAVSSTQTAAKEAPEQSFADILTGSVVYNNEESVDASGDLPGTDIPWAGWLISSVETELIDEVVVQSEILPSHLDHESFQDVAQEAHSQSVIVAEVGSEIAGNTEIVGNTLPTQPTILNDDDLIILEDQHFQSHDTTNIASAEPSASVLYPTLTDTDVLMQRVESPQTDISHVELTQAEVTQAELTQAELAQVESYQAALSQAELPQAELSQVESYQAALPQAELPQTELSQAVLLESEQDPKNAAVNTQTVAASPIPTENPPNQVSAKVNRSDQSPSASTGSTANQFVRQQMQLVQYQSLVTSLDELEQEMLPIKFNDVFDQNLMSQPQPTINIQVNGLPQTVLPSTTSTLQLTLPIQNPQWTQNFAERMFWSAQNNITRAEIHLNPPELGPLSARIRIDDDKASLMFVSQHLQVREAVESALPRLRILFEGSELELSDVSVTDQQQKSFEERYQQLNQSPFEQNALISDVNSAAVQIAELPVNDRRGLVDFYA